MKYIYDIETFAENELDVMKYGKYSPNPLKEKIVCISLLHVYIDNDPISFHGHEEKEILENFWKTIQYCDELIGFCSNSFDWQFVIISSLINVVRIIVDLNKLK